jgi:hypothetical protein
MGGKESPEESTAMQYNAVEFQEHTVYAYDCSMSLRRCP